MRCDGRKTVPAPSSAQCLRRCVQRFPFQPPLFRRQRRTRAAASTDDATPTYVDVHRATRSGRPTHARHARVRETRPRARSGRRAAHDGNHDVSVEGLAGLSRGARQCSTAMTALAVSGGQQTPHGNGSESRNRLRCRIQLGQAEGEGFEPSTDPEARNGFRDRRIRPLCHPSEPGQGTGGRLAASVLCAGSTEKWPSG
jgi:hypothetical protein